MALKGGCLCGGVRYEINDKITGAANCHCSMCRKQSGAAFATAAGVPTKNFKWTAGENLIQRYESSPGAVRMFCKKCGSSLAGGSSDPKADTLWLMLGTLDDDPGVKPSAHIFVGSKAPWYEISDKLPQHKEFPG
jgi:hypothetical protein